MTPTALGTAFGRVRARNYTPHPRAGSRPRRALSAQIELVKRGFGHRRASWRAVAKHRARRALEEIT